MFDLLTTFVFVAIYIAILRVVENPTIRRIRESTDIKDILRQRRKLTRIRKTSFVLFLLCISLPLLIIAYLDARHNIETLGPAFYIASFIYAFAGSYLWIRRRTSHNPLGSTYDLSRDDVLNAQKPYVLFLRSFEKDDYTPEVFIKKRTKSFPAFSEYHFTQLLDQYRNTYAVGMTKEIEAPCGAQRVYLSDAEWQADVIRLMERASSIIILLDARPSCIWEIEQSTAMLSKTIFIVDNADTYREAAQKLSSTIALPALEGQLSTPLALHTADGEHFSVTPFEHNLRSYRGIIRKIAEEYLGQKARMAPFRRLMANPCAKFLLVYLMSSFMSALSELVFYDAHGRLPAEGVTDIHTIILILLYYGCFTNTLREMVVYGRKLFRWVLLIVSSLVCAEQCATLAGEYHIVVRVSSWLLFLAVFSLAYHACVLPLVARIGAAWSRK